MTPKYIFCQCMKPWKLCINKPNSYKIDARDLIDIYRLKCEKNCCNFNYDINFDFVNMRPTNTKFVCRFSDSLAKKQ